MVVLKEGTVLGLEILVYTEHIGDGLTRPVFRNQFQNLSKDTIQAATIKPLPKEPKTSLALLEAVTVALKQN